jgi:hypothetical protein
MMKTSIENALSKILANTTLEAQWEFALKHGGAEKIIQTCLAQELSTSSHPNTFIEFKNADIAIFYDGVDSEPTHIIEIGINYLCQRRDAQLKPLKDIFKRISPEIKGDTYSLK